MTRIALGKRALLLLAHCPLVKMEKRDDKSSLKSKLLFLTPLGNLTGNQKVRVIARIRPFVDQENSSHSVAKVEGKAEISIENPRYQQERLKYK